MGDKTNLSCLPQASWLRDDTFILSFGGFAPQQTGGVTFIHRLRVILVRLRVILVRLRVILSGGRSP